MASSASQSVAAVTPEPQLVMIGRVEIDAAGGETLGDLSRRDQPAVLDQLGDRHVERARHVAGAHARPRLGRFAAEAIGGPRIDHLGGFLRQRLLHVGDARDQRAIELRVEACAARACLRRSRPAGLPPSISAGRRRG